MTPVAWVIGIVFYLTIIAVYSGGEEKSSLHEFADMCLDSLSNMMMLVVAFWAAYLAFTFSTPGGVDWNVAGFVLCFYSVPAILLWTSKGQGNKLCVQDILAILSVYGPLATHYWPERHTATRYDKPMVLVSVMLICMFLWIGLRRMKGTKVQFNFRFSDFWAVHAILGFMVCILLALALKLDFVSVEKFQANLKHLSWTKFLLGAILTLINTPLTEEFFFRGSLQNLLDKRFGQNLKALLLGSLIFGAEHLGQGTKSWNPATWNWTYFALSGLAGIGYGTIYRLSSSLLWVVWAHCWVDVLWGLFK